MDAERLSEFIHSVVGDAKEATSLFNVITNVVPTNLSRTIENIRKWRSQSTKNEIVSRRSLSIARESVAAADPRVPVTGAIPKG